MEIVADTLADLYKELRRELLVADEVDPRGYLTKELMDVHLVLTNPRSRLMYHKDRGFSLPFAIAEAALLYAPVNSLHFFTWANKRMADFSDDGRTLYGAYGRRIFSYIDTIVSDLKIDNETRQAVLPIFEVEDLDVTTKNIPCTLSLHFLLRKNKLHMFTYMRSNDFIWGWPYDVFCFTCLQETIANSLGADLGSYSHNVSSFHLYERHFDLVERIGHTSPIECSFSQTTDDFKELVLFYFHLASGRDPRNYVCSGSLGPFAEILRNYAMFRKGIRPLSLTDEAQWAYPFVKDWYDV